MTSNSNCRLNTTRAKTSRHLCSKSLLKKVETRTEQRGIPVLTAAAIFQLEMDHCKTKYNLLEVKSM